MINLLTAPARDAAARAAAAMTTIKPGDLLMVDLPTGLFSRMEAARRIGIEAARILGTGNYSVTTRSHEGRAVVTFLKGPTR